MNPENPCKFNFILVDPSILDKIYEFFFKIFVFRSMDASKLSSTIAEIDESQA
jgi:hypothetical protein